MGKFQNIWEVHGILQKIPEKYLEITGKALETYQESIGKVMEKYHASTQKVLVMYQEYSGKDPGK